MKRAILLVLVLLVIALAFPVANLLVGLPTNDSLAALKSDDAALMKAAGILGKKCINCHSAEYKLPFYAKFPVAKDMIEQDIKLGTDHIDLAEALMTQNNAPVSEAVLAKNERVIQRDTMPPMRYLALHWNGGLSAQEKQDILAWVKATRRTHYATPDAPASAQENILQPIPKSHSEDPVKVALGERLFHDKRLSKDNTIACASCHALDKGGTDQKKFSEGVGGALGGINAPTVFNSGFAFIQFWDGRAASLEAQADGPVNNPIEMASNWGEAIPKLEQDAELTAEFKAAYPEGYSKETITSAIATFERTLITPNSKFDKYLAGDQAALSADEKAGYQLFLDNACATCHVGKAMGGQSFERMGLKADYFTDRGTPLTDADNGRASVTKNEKDKHRFKTPTLRNIALTAPYFHDSTTGDLAQAVKTMLKYQVGSPLTDAQVGQVVAFLKTLTGEYNGKPLS